MVERDTQSFTDILKGNVGVMAWTRVILFFPRQLHDPYFSLYIRALDGSPESIGFVGFMVSFASLIVVPIAGYLADYYGRVKLIASSFYLRSLAYLTYALSGSWQWLAIGKFYQGLTEYNHAAQTAIIADSLRPGSRAVGFAISNQLYKIVTLFAPPIGAFVIATFGLELGIRYLLIFTTICMFLVGFCRQKFLTETVDSGERQPERRSVVAIIKESYRSSWEILKWTPKSLAILVLIEAISTFSAAMVGPFWVVYAEEIVKLTVTEWATILLLAGFLGLVLSIPAGMFVDRIGNKRIISTMLFLSLFPAMLFIRSSTFVHALVAQLALITIASFLRPAASALMANMVPRTIRARVVSAYGRGEIGIIGGGWGVGGSYVLTIPILFGYVAGGLVYGVNPAYPWIVQIISLFMCFVISVFFLHEPEIPEV